MFFKETNINFTIWLATVKQLKTEEIQLILETKLHDLDMEACHSWGQGTFWSIQLGSVSQELLFTDIVNSSSEFKTDLFINIGETIEIFLKQSDQVLCISSSYRNFRYRVTDGYTEKHHCLNPLMMRYATWFYWHESHLCKQKFVNFHDKELMSKPCYLDFTVHLLWSRFWPLSAGVLLSFSILFQRTFWGGGVFLYKDKHVCQSFQVLGRDLLSPSCSWYGTCCHSWHRWRSFTFCHTGY